MSDIKDEGIYKFVTMTLNEIGEQFKYDGKARNVSLDFESLLLKAIGCSWRIASCRVSLCASCIPFVNCKDSSTRLSYLLLDVLKYNRIPFI